MTDFRHRSKIGAATTDRFIRELATRRWSHVLNQEPAAKVVTTRSTIPGHDPNLASVEAGDALVGQNSKLIRAAFTTLIPHLFGLVVLDPVSCQQLPTVQLTA